MARARKKVEVELPNTEPEVSSEVAVVKKTRKPRTSSKPSYAELEKQLEATKHLLEQTQAHYNQMETAVNSMAADYTRITNYVMKSLNVFYESVLMAFKEDKK